MMARDGYCHYRPVPPEFRAQEEATEMSQGPYPPGYDPADGPQPPRRQPGDGYQDPTQYGERGPEAGRFGSLRYEEGPGGAPPERKSRRGLIIGVVVAVVAVLVLGAVGFFFLVSSNSGSNFAVNSCVRRSGDKA